MSGMVPDKTLLWEKADGSLGSTESKFWELEMWLHKYLRRKLDFFAVSCELTHTWPVDLRQILSFTFSSFKWIQCVVICWESFKCIWIKNPISQWYHWNQLFAIRLCEDKNINHVWTCLIATMVANLGTLITRSKKLFSPLVNNIFKNETTSGIYDDKLSGFNNGCFPIFSLLLKMFFFQLVEVLNKVISHKRPVTVVLLWSCVDRAIDQLFSHNIAWILYMLYWYYLFIPY